MPALNSDKQIELILAELQKCLDVLNRSEEITQEIKKCKEKYAELLQIVGELNDQFSGE